MRRFIPFLLSVALLGFVSQVKSADPSGKPTGDAASKPASGPALAPGIDPGALRNMKAYPPAAEGQVRHVLLIPKKDDESAFKVEIIVGKTVQVDAENRYFFGGKIKEESIQGWGFTRYVVGDLGPMAGTRMAPDPNAPKVNRFISLGGEPYLIRYNSKLPIVVYVPEGVEVRYRIWSADPEAKAVEKG